MQIKGLHKILTKALSIALVIMLIGANARFSLSFAQEAPPDPTPTTTDVAVTNDSTQTTTSDSNANTGGDGLGTPTPTADPTITDVTVTPSPDPTITPDPTTIDSQITPADSPTPEATDSGITVDNNGTVTDNTSADVNSGHNSIETTGGGEHHDGNGSGQPTSSVTTGDAASVTNVDTSVNTTSINSQVVYQTINLYVDQNGDIDLSMPAELARALVAQNPDMETINAAIASVSNDANVTIDVTGSANTGGNTATGKNVTIHTGDAITLMSILNRINFVMIDSVVHVVIINIFGNFTGNIFLPDLPTATPTPCPECGSLTVTNGATVNNTVNLTADTGHNTATGSAASITTGNAYGNIQLINLVNTVLYGTSTFQLYILDHGFWDGSFLGWANAEGATNNGLLVDPSTTQCPTCITNAQITNAASLTNNILGSATTGNNSASGNNADITTGNAYVSAAILNFVNTSLIRSFGFFGFINVLGSWTGNIGSKSLFASPTPEPEASSQDTGGGAVREQGGQLSMTQSNNVGDHVDPGDTVTFFLTLNNPGNGRVFDTSVILHLFKNGVDVGGVTIPVGNIKIGGTVKITTGLQLSPKAPGGPYIAHAVATGHVGAGDDKVTASANSMFMISGAFASTGGAAEGTAVVSGSAPPNVQVMGATTKTSDNPNVLLALLVLLALIPEYIFYRATRDRRLFTFVFTGDLNWQARLRAVQTLLL